MERARWIWPLSILGFALLLRLALFTGLQGGDDRIYSAEAYRMSRGEFSPGQDILCTRVAYVGSIAAAYALFGAHVACLVAPSLLASLGLVALAYRLGLVFASAPVARVAALFAALLPLDVFCATTGSTDLFLAALIGLGVCLLCDPATGGKTGWALLAGAAWGAAHLTKESALLLLLAAVPLLWKRAPRKSTIIAAAVALSIVVAELALYGLGTRDPLYRVHVARAALGAGGSSAGFLNRLGALPSFCLNPAAVTFPFTGGLAVLSAAGAVWVAARDRRRSGAVALWWLAGGLLLTLFPVTLLPYRPALPLQARMFAVLTLPGALLAGLLLVDALGRFRWMPFVGGAAALLALACGIRVHEDAVRWRAGAEWAHRTLEEHPGAIVISDPRTAAVLRMLSSYQMKVDVRAYAPSDPPPAEGTILLDCPRLAAACRDWDGIAAPGWWISDVPARKTMAESFIAAPVRLRGPRGPAERIVLSVVTKDAK